MKVYQVIPLPFLSTRLNLGLKSDLKLHKTSTSVLLTTLIVLVFKTTKEREIMTELGKYDEGELVC